MQLSKSFAYNGLTVRVECADQAPLTWVEEFLSPAFTPVEDGTADCTVTLEIDERRYATVRRWGAHPDGRRVAGFAFDSGPVELALWASAQQDRVLFDVDSEVFYFVNQDGSHIRVLSASHHPSRRIALMRVVREFVMSDSWTRTRFVLHAGACELANAGIIIAGPKGAGKTTLLMYALGCAGARFIANDRVVVSVDGPQAMVRGMPTVVSVRAHTLRCFPAFERQWAASHYNERWSLQEAQQHGAPPVRADPINLTPAQFCMLLGVPLCASGRARILLFPRLTDDIEGLRVQELPHDVAIERLAASIFAASSAPQISQVFALPTHASPPDTALVRELSRVLIRRVRSFDCRLGQPGAYTAVALQDFLRPLLAAPPTPLFTAPVERRA